MRFDLLVRGATLVSGAGRSSGDLGVVGGRIEAVGELTHATAETVLEAGGLVVLPGVIDSHVHLREPGSEHKEDLESGTRAAVLGGVTAVFEMPNTHPATTNAEALADKLRRAKGRTWCHHAFYVGATPDNAVELAALPHVDGLAGVKIFMGSSTGDLLVPDDEGLLRVLHAGTLPVAVHSEDEYRLRERMEMLAPTNVALHPLIRDAECARRGTERLLTLCGETRRAVHILHVSTADELPLIAEAKRRGVPVTAEICPQHLIFAAPECYERLGTLVQQNPPIRDAVHREALRRALVEGLFDTVGTDHAPHLLSEKALPYPSSPSGMPGVQTLVPAMLNLVAEGLLSIEQFVRLACEGPARVFGASGRGALEPGFAADFTIIDLDAVRLVERPWLASRCGWSPYEGLRWRGWPIHTVVGGVVAMRDGELSGSPQGAPMPFRRLNTT